MVNATIVSLALSLLLLAAPAAAKHDTLAYAKLKERILFAPPCEGAPFEWVSERVAMLQAIKAVQPDTMYMESKEEFVAVFGTDTLSITTSKNGKRQIFHSMSFKLDAGSVQGAAELRKRLRAAMSTNYAEPARVNPYNKDILTVGTQCPKQVYVGFSIIEDPASQVVSGMCHAL